MLYCSPRVLDIALIQTILLIINHEKFSLEYLQNIKEDQLAEMIKSVGIQHKCANNLKIAIDQIGKNLEVRYLEWKKNSGRFMVSVRKFAF